MEKHDLETPSMIKITLKGFEWSNFQLKFRKASLILIGLSVKKTAGGSAITHKQIQQVQKKPPEAGGNRREAL